jgi:hypothetical protein
VPLFLLLSLICAAANELIEALRKNRCGDLEKGILELVGGGPRSDFVSQIYNHGAVNSLFRGNYGTAPRRDLLSYISAANFALALLSVVKDTDEARLPGKVRSALTSLRKTAGNDEAKLQKSIKDLYKSAMDRLSGWYIPYDFPRREDKGFSKLYRHRGRVTGQLSFGERYFLCNLGCALNRSARYVLQGLPAKTMPDTIGGITGNSPNRSLSGQSCRVLVLGRITGIPDK